MYSSRTAVTSKRKAAVSPEIQRDAPDLDPDDLDLTLELDSNIRCDLDSGLVFPESAEIPALIPPEAPHLYRPFKKGYKGLPKHPNMFICSSCFKSWHRINQFQCTKCDERYGHLSQRPTVHKSLHFSCLWKNLLANISVFKDICFLYNHIHILSLNVCHDNCFSIHKVILSCGKHVIFFCVATLYFLSPIYVVWAQWGSIR